MICIDASSNTSGVAVGFVSGTILTLQVKSSGFLSVYSRIFYWYGVRAPLLNRYFLSFTLVFSFDYLLWDLSRMQLLTPQGIIYHNGSAVCGGLLGFYKPLIYCRQARCMTAV